MPVIFEAIWKIISTNNLLWTKWCPYNHTTGGTIVDGVVYDSINGNVYAVNAGSGTISAIDGSTNKVVDTITGAPDPVQLVYKPSNHYMYVAGHNSNIVSVIDTRTNKLVDILNGFEDPTGVGYNSDTGNICIGNQGSNYASVLSGSTNKIIETVTVGRGPVTPVFDPNNGNVYVTDFGSNENPNNTVSVISTTTLTPKQAIQKLIHTIDNMHLSKGILQ